MRRAPTLIVSLAALAAACGGRSALQDPGARPPTTASSAGGAASTVSSTVAGTVSSSVGSGGAGGEPPEVWGDGFPATPAGLGQAVIGGTAMDAQGNVYLAGAFEGTLELQGVTLTSAGLRDFMLIKISPAGQVEWARAFGNAADNGFAISLALDPAGDPILAGGLSGTVDFGGGPLTSPSAESVFAASFDGAGAHRWSRIWSGTGYEGASGVAADPQGDVLVAGVRNGNSSSQLTTNADAVLFLYKLSGADGTDVWSETFPQVAAVAEYLYAPAIAVGAEGTIVLAGSVAGGIDLGGGPLTTTPAGGMLKQADVYVAAYDPGGAPLWSVLRGGVDSQDWATSVAVDAQGGYAITGISDPLASAPGDFGGGPLACPSPQGGPFLARYDATGALVFSRCVFPGYNEGADGSLVVAFDPAGHVLWNGLASSAPPMWPGTDFGGGLIGADCASGAWLAAYESTGAYVSSRIVCGLIADHGLAVDPVSGAVAVAGEIDGTSVQFPSGTVSLPPGTGWGIAVGVLPPVGKAGP